MEWIKRANRAKMCANDCYEREEGLWNASKEQNTAQMSNNDC